MIHAPLSVSGLEKRYGDVDVLKQLELQVEPHAVHGLVGLNGSGKTTTLECILGMQAFQGGRISVLGHTPDRLYQAQGKVVSIFDSPSLNPSLTVRQALEHARLLIDRPTRTPEEVERLLGISKYSRYRIRQLSLGNRRRASIAQALLGKPAFVILDEPFNGLDAGGVEDVLALIRQLNREEGTAFLLSSHQLPYLEQICSHLAILHQGEIAMSDRVNALFDSRQTRLTLRCEPVAAAVELLRRQPGVTVEAESTQPDSGSASQGEIRVLPGALPSAQINRLLVDNGISVSELRVERPSLSLLFHEITAPADAPAHHATRGAV